MSNTRISILKVHVGCASRNLLDDEDRASILGGMKTSDTRIVIVTGLTFASGMLVSTSTFVYSAYNVARKTERAMKVTISDFQTHIIESAGFVLLCALLMPIVSDAPSPATIAAARKLEHDQMFSC